MTLAAKLSAVMAAIDVVAKRGENRAQGYTYVKAADVAREVRGELVKAGVAFALGVDDVRTEFISRGDKAPFVMFTVLGKASFIDGETGETLIVPFAGAGGDYGMEKGIYKAITGGLKYLLRMTFLIPDEEDPEAPLRDADDVAPAGPVGANITVLGATAVTTDPSGPKGLTARQKEGLRSTGREKGLDGDAWKAYVLSVTGKSKSTELNVADYEKLILELGKLTTEEATDWARTYAAVADVADPVIVPPIA